MTVNRLLHLSASSGLDLQSAVERGRILVKSMWGGLSKSSVALYLPSENFFGDNGSLYAIEQSSRFLTKSDVAVHCTKNPSSLEFVFFIVSFVVVKFIIYVNVKDVAHNILLLKDRKTKYGVYPDP